MKILLMAATAALFLVSCGGKKDDKKTGGGGTGSGEAVALKLNVQPGDNFNQKMVMNMNVTTEAQGQSITVKMGFDAAMRFDVMAADSANGSTNVKMTYTSADATMDMGAAAGAMGGQINEMMGKVMKAMVGESMLINIDKSGKASEPLNYDEFKARLTTKLDSLGVPGASGQQITDNIGKKNLANSMQMMFNIYPDNAVKPGDSWTKEIVQDMNGIPMTMKNEYTLNKVDNGIAYISIKTTATADGGNATTANGSKVSDMKLTQKGDMEMSVAKGYIKKANIEMKMDGHVEAMGTKMPMKGDAKYAISE